jgi:TPR repeat protein
MLKKVLVILMLFCVNLYADLVSDGLSKYESGNYQQAAMLFEKACDGGYATGCYNLGVLYANGQGVNQNYQKAAKLYNKACDGGNATGCNNLGLSYKYGQGVRQNITTAKEFFGKACDGGNQKGCDNYRILNEQGY